MTQSAIGPTGTANVTLFAWTDSASVPQFACTDSGHVVYAQHSSSEFAFGPSRNYADVLVWGPITCVSELLYDLAPVNRYEKLCVLDDSRTLVTFVDDSLITYTLPSQLFGTKMFVIGICSVSSFYQMSVLSVPMYALIFYVFVISEIPPPDLATRRSVV